MYYDSEEDDGEIEIDTEGQFAGLPMTPAQKRLVLNAQKVVSESESKKQQPQPIPFVAPPTSVFHMGSSSSNSNNKNNKKSPGSRPTGSKGKK